jgi:hypothetical protein
MKRPGAVSLRKPSHRPIIDRAASTAAAPRTPRAFERFLPHALSMAGLLATLLVYLEFGRLEKTYGIQKQELEIKRQTQDVEKAAADELKRRIKDSQAHHYITVEVVSVSGSNPARYLITARPLLENFATEEGAELHLSAVLLQAVAAMRTSHPLGSLNHSRDVQLLRQISKVDASREVGPAGSDVLVFRENKLRIDDNSGLPETLIPSGLYGTTFSAVAVAGSVDSILVRSEFRLKLRDGSNRSSQETIMVPLIPGAYHGSLGPWIERQVRAQNKK